MKGGLAIHIFTANSSMSDRNRAFCNSDGDLLIGAEI
jgi:hypothetical protein